MNDGGVAPSTTPLTGFGLKSGVSFCRVDGRSVFLDVSADRYFCLSPAGENAFSRLLDGAALDDRDRAALENLAQNGPLVRDPSSNIAPCAAIDVPRASYLDEPRPAGLRDTVAAAASLIRSPLRLRLFGLRNTLARVERRKRRSAARVAPGRLCEVASAFARLRLFATEKDNCLIRSIAVVERLISIGAAPQLVIAVKLQPFYAHAWVQCDGRLVNDRHEFVRNYTPILVV